MTFKVKDFGKKDYIEMYDLMRNFTLNRNASTEDEIWLVEHPSIYTLGLSKKIEHIIDVSNIPVVSTDRGGQVTYHGPGQLIIYLLIDLNRRSYKVKKLVLGSVNMSKKRNIAAKKFKSYFIAFIDSNW